MLVHYKKFFYSPTNAQVIVSKKKIILKFTSLVYSLVNKKL